MSIRSHDRWLRVIAWREKYIKERQFILILSILIGFFASVAVFILETMIHALENYVMSLRADHQLNILIFILPALGLLLAYLFVRYIVRDEISHGITRILYAISQHKAIIKLHNIWTSIIASSITIGFGGSVGAEAPIVLTGSAIGSNLGQLFRLDQKTMMLLVGCGASGAISGIFKAPFAGVVFTLEVLLLDMTMSSIAPLLLSSLTATVFSYVFMGYGAMFKFTNFEIFDVERIPYIILLGVFCGFVSLYFIRGMTWLEGIFNKMDKPYKRILLGGSMLSVLVFLFPPLYGEGYTSIRNLLSGDATALFHNSVFQSLSSNPWVVVGYLFLIVFFKVFASAATNGGGGTGGTFAPAMFVGGVAGFAFAKLLNLLGFSLPLQNFAFAGMAGLMSGVMHAPLTGIFLIAELTGGYDLFITLMITSVVAYLTIILFEPHSLYAKRLAQKGELLTHHKDRAVLTLMKTENVVEKNFITIQPEMSLGELVKVISKSCRNVFPVVNPQNGLFLGIVTLDEVRNIMFRPELYNRFKVKELMISPPAKINENMPMEKVMDVFEDSNAWNLPVVDNDGKYVGFVSKSKIFNSYRKVLVHFSDD